MKTLDEIRQDLRDIGYYYSRKETFDDGVIGHCSIAKKVSKYNKVASTAAPRLYDIYVSLHVKNTTQAALSRDLGYTPQYIQMLNKELLEYIQTELVS